MFAVFAALTLAMSRVGGVLTYQGSPVSGNVLKHRPISHYTVTLPAPAAKKKDENGNATTVDGGRAGVLALVVPFGCLAERSRFEALCTTACAE